MASTGYDPVKRCRPSAFPVHTLTMAEVDLPEDVMVNILCWLPVKSLIRFTSVSKRWRFIILSDPNFATSQSNAARQRKTHVPRLLVCTGGPQLDSIDLDKTASFGRPSSVIKLSLPPERLGGAVSLLGSCNGLVFLACNDASHFYMWNPATRFFRELPEPGFPEVCEELKYRGVGYLSATEDYRVFADSYGLYEDGDSYEQAAETKMFSSRTHVWKTIRDSGHGLPDTPYQGILLNEALHWAKFDHIVAFDFTTEAFRKMRLLDRGVDFQYVGVSEGCLCVCGYLSGRHDSVDYWVMREYGVDNSWTKLFNFSLEASPGRYGDWLVMEGFTVAVNWVIHLNGVESWLLEKIDHQPEVVIEGYMGQDINDCYLSMIPYEDSLLRIND